MLPTKRKIFFPDEQSAKYFDQQIGKRDAIKARIEGLNLEESNYVHSVELLDEDDFQRLLTKLAGFESTQNQRVEEISSLDRDLLEQLKTSKDFKGLSRETSKPIPLKNFPFEGFTPSSSHNENEYVNLEIVESCFFFKMVGYFLLKYKRGVSEEAD